MADSFYPAHNPGNAALDAFLETTIRRGVYILSTALVLIGLPMWLVLATCVTAGSAYENPTFNPDADLTTNRMLSVPEGSFVDWERFHASR